MSAEVKSEVFNAPPEVKGQFPGEYWNTDTREATRQRVAEIRENIGSADAIGIVDSDLDGLGCEVVLNIAYDNPVIVQGRGGKYQVSMEQMLDIVAESSNNSAPVIIADLSPDSTFSGLLAKIATIDNPVRYYDHHKWNWEAKESFKVVDNLVINKDLSAAQIVLQEELDNPDEKYVEFTDVVADHDLWKKEDGRSDYLSTLAFEVDRDVFVKNAKKYGANMHLNPDLRERYEEQESRTEQYAELAVEMASWFHISEYNVAITYFDCHASRVGDMLIQNGADIAVIIQPTLSVSFRSDDTFTACDELADGLDGGGHEQAAGASLYHHVDTSEYDSEELYIPEIDDEEPDVDDKFEITWRTAGTDAKSFMRQYLERTLD